jgi:hypothetical protein
MMDNKSLEATVAELVALMQTVREDVHEIKENMARRSDVDRHEDGLKDLEKRVRDLEAGSNRQSLAWKILDKAGLAGLGAGIGIFIKHFFS